MDIADIGRGNIRIAVLGGSGGVGASTFAAVLAWAAGAALLDLDAVGGGLDVLLGIERTPGARWSALRLGGGRLDPRLLLEGLPHWYGVPVLAADLSPPPAEGVPEVIAAAAGAGPVVLDVPRAPCPVRTAALTHCDVAVLLARARVPELSAARALLAGVVPLVELPIGVLLRPGDVPREEAALLLGRPVIGAVPTPARSVELAAGRPPRALLRVASGVLDGLP
jgi:hypothetical protein